MEAAKQQHWNCVKSTTKLYKVGKRRKKIELGMVCELVMLSGSQQECLIFSTVQQKLFHIVCRTESKKLWKVKIV